MPFVTAETFLPEQLNTQFPAFVSYFAGGMFFAFSWEKIVPRIKFLGSVAAALFILLSVKEIFFVSNFFRPVCLAFSVMFFALKAKPFFKIVHNDFSYGMYLVHFPLVMCFVSLGFFERNWNFAFMCIAGVSFFFSYLLNCAQKKFFGGKK
jgi:hypothetical protein